jgi:ADP-ribose pyrophosphatase YjhB (NUDIX family)
MIDHKTGGMYIGVVQEDRKLAGGMVYNVPRGFLDSGETHSEAAVREVHEETGLAVMASRLIHLGNGINPNMAFFDTSRTTVDGQPEGVSIFGLPVYYNEVETIVGPEGQIHYRFREEIRAEAQPESPEERILGSIFIPMAEAVQSPDVYTSAAAGRLIAHMLGNGIMRLSHIEHPKS